MLKKNNRKVIGICPKVYADNFDILDCDEEIVTDTMLDSTIKIIERSNAIIVLPGGYGTLYELFASIQEKVSKEHNLPIILYNSCGFYNGLIEFVKKLKNENFIKTELEENFFIANNVEEVLSYLK